MIGRDSRQQLRLPWVIVAVAVTSLILIPLLGLLSGLINPPQTPFTTNIHFTDLLVQNRILQLLLTTVLLSLLVSFLASAIGICLAWLEQRTLYPGVKYLAALDLLPLAIPSYLLAATLRESLAPNSMLGGFLGTPIFRGFFPAVIVLTLVTVPYVQLLVSSTLTRLSAAEEEAARCLGKSSWQIFWRIIFPRLRPAFAFAWLMTLLYVVSDFGAVAVLDTPVLTWRLYQFVEHQQLAQASVLGIMILLLTLPVLLLARWFHGQVPAITSVSNPRPVVPKPLTGLSLVLAYCLHVLVIGLGVVLPVIALATWVFHGWDAGASFASLWLPVTDTIKVLFLSAPVIVLLALLPAWVVAHSRWRVAGIIEQVIYLTRSLPGLLLAFGLMLWALFVSRLAINHVAVYHALLTSGILLLLAYTIRFIPEAYAGLKSTILLFDPRLTETARLLNASKWRYMLRVLSPALLPGVITAFLLVLLTLIKELPIMLLLGGAMGWRTLAFRFFDRYQEAFLHDAGLAGLMLLLFSFILLVVALPWRRHV